MSENKKHLEDDPDNEPLVVREAAVVDKIKNVPFRLNLFLNAMTPPDEAKGTYTFTPHGDLIISCAKCARVALVMSGHEVHQQIVTGIGFRCSKCQYQCHTRLMTKGVSNE